LHIDDSLLTPGSTLLLYINATAASTAPPSTPHPAVTTMAEPLSVLLDPLAVEEGEADSEAEPEADPPP
jgi:hypothetical protein